jgi:hypothetical protein
VSYDDDRVVSFDEEILVLPDHGADEAEAAGWSDSLSSNDERLLEERPPHWD